ncbi:unnamed protein product, partial [marine sediment metagenome]
SANKLCFLAKYQRDFAKISPVFFIGIVAERFELNKNQIGPGVQFLKPNQLVEVLKFKDKIINISLPIK